MASEFINNLTSFQNFKIEIFNWDKYNERDTTKKGASSYRWFKISDDHLSDAKILSLSDSGYKLFIALLCIASKQNSQIVGTNLTHLRQFVGKKLANIRHNLVQMEEIALVQVIENIQNEDLHKIRRDKIRRDKMQIINIAPQNNLLKITDLWLSVLSTFGIERSSPHLQEAQMLHSLLNANGFENLALAIIGMSYETKSDSYQPEKFLSTKLLANNFERFLNLGAKNKLDFIKNNISKLTKESFDLIQRLDTNHA